MNKRSFIQLLKKTSPSNESSIKGLNNGNYSHRVRFIHLSFDYLDNMHDYLIPKKIIILSNFPLKNSGKIDKNTLKSNLSKGVLLNYENIYT